MFPWNFRHAIVHKQRKWLVVMWVAFVPFAFANCADLPHLPLWFESFQPILHWLNPGVVRLLLGDHAKGWGLLLGFWMFLGPRHPHAFSLFRRRRMIRMAGIILRFEASFDKGHCGTYPMVFVGKTGILGNAIRVISERYLATIFHLATLHGLGTAHRTFGPHLNWQTAFDTIDHTAFSISLEKKRVHRAPS